MKHSYEGIGHLAVTFPAFDSVPGHVCKLNLNGDATMCDSGDKFIGVTEAVQNYMAAVQVEGFATVRYSGTKPDMGYVSLVADGDGGVMIDSTGRAYLVVSVDSEEMTAVIKL